MPKMLLRLIFVTHLFAVFHCILQTQEERDSLNASIAKQRTEARLHREYLDSERQRMKQLSDQLEVDKVRARTERQLLRESSELERSRLEAEHERQLMEWAELEKERRHQLTLRQNDSVAAQQQLVCHCSCHNRKSTDYQLLPHIKYP